MMVTHKKALMPLVLSLSTGVIFSFLFDRIPILGTHIPSCGYYSTVIFTEPSMNIYCYYFFITLTKGLFYLVSFYLLQKLF